MSGTYTLRRLTNGDAWRAARIAAQVLADPRISMSAAQIAAQDAPEESKNQALALVIVGALMEHAPDELEAFLRDLTGLSKEEFDELPVNASFEIVADIMESEDFGPLSASVLRLTKVARTAFSSLRSPSRNGSGSKTKKS